MDTLTRIKTLAAEQFGGDADTIDVDKPVDQLGIDSLGFLEFLFELEDRVAISIPTDAVAQVKTPRELATVVDGMMGAAQQSSTV